MKLHDYQIVARDFLRRNDRGALFLDMGLGKTACTLTALEPRHLPVLVTAPKRVAEEVWAAETALWRPDLTCVVAKGTPAQRAAVLTSSGADIVVIGRDVLADVLRTARQRTDPPYATLVIDELSGFKTKTSVRWKTANKAIKHFRIPHVWGLTGTPNPNGYLDLWGQVALLDGGDRLGKNLTTYRSRYFTPGRRLPSGVVIQWHLVPGADKTIQRAIEDICLAMETDGRIQLPPTTYNDIGVELPAAIRTKYREFTEHLVVDLREVFAGEVHTAGNAATLTARLSQITSGFMYVDDADVRGYKATRLHTVKVDALKEIVEATHGSPLLVFYRFREEANMIKEAFPDAWTMDDKDVIAKWNKGHVPMLLAHPASAGHGLNLQHGGHHVVWTSPTWDYEQYAQANKRLARQGQKHPVIIHHLLANKTVDHRIRRRLDEKAAVQYDLLQYLESPL